MLNGNGTAGIAGTWADRLGSEGFIVDTIGDAGSFDYSVTQLIVAAENAAMADVVRDSLGFGEIVPGSVGSGVDVIVVLGADAS